MLNLVEHYRQTRQQSEAACQYLEIEDYSLQAEAFTSPPKWHIAHTSWFFETFLLKPYLPGYQSLDDQYAYLFNSYYNGIGEQFARPRRGLLSRPTVAEVFAYRRHVDEHMLQLLGQRDHPHAGDIRQRCRLGIEHEQQHQELFYTDLKYSLFCNPLLPAYRQSPLLGASSSAVAPMQWQRFDEQLVELGYAGNDFAFDNEGPRHKVFLAAYALADRLVSNAEYLQFMQDDGYQRPELWLADGWAALQETGWRRPHYWLEHAQELCEYTLHGVLQLQPAQPVCHLSAYEADAYARWAGYRLPTEAEWEHAANSAPLPIAAAGADDGVLQPQPCTGAGGLQQLYSECWQWTSSAYAPYTGFAAASGAIGEYNGKFMCNQLVLRGGSCVSKQTHLRPSYRNFFYPQDRWQFSGIRLAQSM